ncbi:VWA domain-containing protein [Entomomonas moraniae]|uniref:VWA domain-containing protein n=1 Tax=Entomomonas moraniae TaxID=2213226 RepID=A0A3Q9JKT5_9GAMM|nr:VWA domain-containing protein [Entomomonas moraniae]AZS51875.1 VWA domain-containing protein [Entomomonas moraniae]
MGRVYNKLAAMCMLLTCATVVQADDAEIFFNKELQHVNPNVIFLLDTSGSMAFNLNNDNSALNNPNRMDSLKDALTAILTDKSITDIRVGVISFSSYLSFIQDIEEIDKVTNESNDKITITKNGSTTTLSQKIIDNANGYASTASNSRLTLPPANVGKTVSSIYPSGAGYLAYRFDNILLNQSSNADTLVKSAKLRIFTRYNGRTSINLYVDPSISPDFLTTTPGFLYNKIRGLSGISCSKTNSYYECPVTDIIKDKIKNSSWTDGAAINFYVKTTASTDSLYISTDTSSQYSPELVIEVDNSLIAENKRTYRDQILEKALTLKEVGGTNTVLALQTMSNYISGIAKKGSQTQGPYHNTQTQFGKEIPSPIEEGCQLTHVILMSDGAPQANRNGYVDSSYYWNSEAAKYMGYSNYNNCRIITGLDKDNNPQTIKETYNTLPSSTGAPNSEACGRAIASWMANIDQTKNTNGANYIRTHTIGFALSNNAKATNFLKEVADYGQGTSKAATNTNELVQAFKDIITDVRATDSPSASGRVTLSAQSRYKQRNEVFYALYASNAYNYWPGNMKGFLLKYIDVTLSDNTKAQRPILVGKDGTTPAMGTDGAIINTVSSFWANSTSDGGTVDKGGVRGMLNRDYTKRPQFTSKSGPLIPLNADNVTATDLDLTGSNAEARKLGLLEFIKGNTYKEGGGGAAPTATPPKIGDSARSGVTLATYGCAQGNSVKLVDCGTLSQTALLASNDGFFRGYDTATGEVLYEYMPQEMLPLINKLEAASIVNYDKPRFYGLDGNVVIYHNDINQNDYIDNQEKAYAYVVSGRGGPYIYAFDISSKDSIKNVWKIKGGEGNFSRLGYTWSVPVLGNIKINGSVTPVLVFGGGYDKKPNEDDPYSTRTATKGNAVYIVNAINGELIQSFTNNMNYSVPSSVALVTDDSSDHLITDIVFGDTGGQVWRFIVNNTAQSSTYSGGMVATLGSDGSDSRKFFQTPSIYQYKDGTQEMISINIGSGFRNHPLSTDINDKIYSLRFPKSSNGTKGVLTEADLAVATVDYNSNLSVNNTLTGSLEHGFMISLQQGGEKVITDGLAEFGRLVFNTYVPVPTDKVTCKPRVGLQRTYVYDLITGESLLQSAYLESNVSALPADVTYYCKGDYCTIVPSTDILSEKKLPAGKDGGDSPLLTNVSGKADPSKYVKTGSTDLFDISPN